VATLNALKKAPVLNEAGGSMPNSKYSLASSDIGIVGVGTVSNAFYAIGVSAGDATLTATRLLDGAIATLEVTVIAAAPFAISLGAEVAA